VRREVLAMSDEAQRKGTVTPVLPQILSEFERAPLKIPPLSLSAVPSEFDKLCAKFGGPADLGIPVDRSLMNYFRQCCGEFRPYQVLPVLLRFAEGQDEAMANRHYPWVAFAISQYHFATREFREYRDEPRPNEILELFGQIDNAAQELTAAIVKIQQLSYRLSDPTAPWRRSHLAWFNALFAQAIAGHPSSDPSNNDIADDLQMLAFLKQLAQLQGAAKIAPEYFDKALVERERGQKNPALRDFVRRCAKIWESLTGRMPNASPVSKKTTSDPDFVIFLKDLAKVGKLPVPTRKQVETSLNPITKKNSS
jgi:hypothetical protein